MENKIMNIDNVRAYENDGTIFINLEDVVRGLGLTQTQVRSGKVYTSVRWERINRMMAGMGFPHKWGRDSYIPENIFYRLAMKANNETALKFQAKVADEIIPTIRKTGGYVNNSELFVNTYFPALSADQKVLIHGLLENGMRQQALIAEMKPKAEFADMVQASEGTLSMSEFAKLLCDKESIQIGRNKLCRLFRDKAVFCQDNKPRQEYMDRKYFEVVETIKNGKPRTASRITGRGQIWATKKIKEWLA